MPYTFCYFLFLSLLLSINASAQNGTSVKVDMNPKHFFKQPDLPVYPLNEVLEASKPIRALSFQESDLIPASYGELCLLDSILQYQQASFIQKIQSVERLYLYCTLPEKLIQLLANTASVKTILLKPAIHSYTSRELQEICLFKAFTKLNYLEGADSSLAFINCLQQLESLDTLVWLDTYLQNPYLERLSNIRTLMIEDYKGQSPYTNWNRPRSRRFNFPAQLTTISSSKLYYHKFSTKLQSCTKLLHIVDASGTILSPETTALHLESGEFPPPNPILKALSFKSSPNKIPSNIHLFSALQSLHIAKDFYGHALKLPSSFYQLANLEVLTIKLDTLSDSIRYLTKLQELSLYLQRSKNISDSIRYLDQLQSLSIRTSGGKLIPLSNAIYKLTNLKTLSLESYTLSDSIRHFTNLRSLTLSGTYFLPKDLSQLTELRQLDLSRCLFPSNPTQVYQLKRLERLLLPKVPYNKKLPIPARQLKQLTHLKYFEFSFRSLKSEFHYQALYKALPEDCKVVVNDAWDSNAPISRFNFGLYMDYGWGQAVFTGGEFLYYFYRPYREKFSKKAGRFGKTATDPTKSFYRSINEDERASPNPFHFHTLSFGVEWNYLPADNFMMGYRLGYNYSRIREPIAFQLDLIAYTNYNNVFDLRLAPRLAVSLVRTSGLYVYLYYSYKIPLISNQEQRTVARHSIGLGARFMVNWGDGIIGFPGVF